jgi:hypothetical protein
MLFLKWLWLRLLYTFYLGLSAFGPMCINRMCDIADEADRLRPKLEA